ncbi:Dabb family protein [Actinoplanes sp. NPDC049668]|uniref:Dabb family protein n=1 Tax=unclassified Actinoplanes TaxID=2626549 RepID=UPI0033B8A380
MLVHVVMMKFADDSDAAKAQSRLVELSGRVPQIRTMDCQIDELRTAVSWDLVLRTTHRDADDLREYQAHPAHHEFGAWVRPLLTDRAVVDYTG